MKDLTLKILQNQLKVIIDKINGETEDMPFGLTWEQMCSLSPNLEKYQIEEREIKNCINWINSI